MFTVFATFESIILYYCFLGLGVEGIFRISAPKSRLDELESIANTRKSVQLTDVHDASGLLKRFLRQLPEHILTEEMRNNFEQIASGNDGDHCDIVWLIFVSRAILNRKDFMF